MSKAHGTDHGSLAAGDAERLSAGRIDFIMECFT